MNWLHPAQVMVQVKPPQEIKYLNKTPLRYSIQGPSRREAGPFSVIGYQKNNQALFSGVY
jgi:hypothetical protein